MARNWARGEAPPEHSWEWVGVALPPKTRPRQVHPPVHKPPVVVAHKEVQTEPSKMGVGRMLGYAGIFAGGVYVGSILYGQGR